MIAGLKNLIFGKTASKNLAKSRLHFVLVQDRTGLTNEDMTGFRRELVEVIERYFVVDQNAFDINYERSGEMTKLIINSPVLVRRQDSSDMSAGSRGKTARERRRQNPGIAAN